MLSPRSDEMEITTAIAPSKTSSAPMTSEPRMNNAVPPTTRRRPKAAASRRAARLIPAAYLRLPLLDAKLRKNARVPRHVAYVQARGLPTPSRVRHQRHVLAALRERHRPLNESDGGGSASGIRPALGFGF